MSAEIECRPSKKFDKNSLTKLLASWKVGERNEPYRSGATSERISANVCRDLGSIERPTGMNQKYRQRQVRNCRSQRLDHGLTCLAQVVRQVTLSWRLRRFGSASSPYESLLTLRHTAAPQHLDLPVDMSARIVPHHREQVIGRGVRLSMIVPVFQHQWFDDTLVEPVPCWSDFAVRTVFH